MEKGTGRLEAYRERICRGGHPKYHEKLKENRKLFVRDRLKLLFDGGDYQEDGMFANCTKADLPADGVVTALGKISGRTVCVMANDSTVKAGSWGAKTVEKIIRIQETAMKLKVPMFYLVDSAGARITDQLEMFPNRRGAGKIFLQPGQNVRDGPPSLHPVRTVRRRRRLYPRLFATSSSWSIKTPPCIWARRGWPRR